METLYDIAVGTVVMCAIFFCTALIKFVFFDEYDDVGIWLFSFALCLVLLGAAAGLGHVITSGGF